MKRNKVELSLDGRQVSVRGARVDGKIVVLRGRLVRRALIHAEEWAAGDAVEDPEQFIGRIRAQRVGADIFSFGQRLPITQPKFRYRFEWDNIAAIPLSDFDDWWMNRLGQKARNSVRRAGKLGVVVRSVPLDERLVRDIMAIYNETPIRQGKPFTHYGMSYEEMREELSAFAGRCEVLGAYLEEELIGFLKLVYREESAGVLHILTKSCHFDKRPTNALIAKAVEVCCEKGMRYLTWGRYAYGNKSDSSLTDFKRRSGFERIDVPRYYVALTPRGRLAMSIGLHLDLLGRLPRGLLRVLLRLRELFYKALLVLRPRVVRRS